MAPETARNVCFICRDAERQAKVDALLGAGKTQREVAEKVSGTTVSGIGRHRRNHFKPGDGKPPGAERERIERQIAETRDTYYRARMKNNFGIMDKCQARIERLETRLAATPSPTTQVAQQTKVEQAEHKLQRASSIGNEFSMKIYVEPELRQPNARRAWIRSELNSSLDDCLFGELRKESAEVRDFAEKILTAASAIFEEDMSKLRELLERSGDGEFFGTSGASSRANGRSTSTEGGGNESTAGSDVAEAVDIRADGAELAQAGIQEL